MDKDRGYAWVILGASTILMCIGPSTFMSYGFLMRDVPLEPDHVAWILNAFYVCWILSAFLASLFAKERPRQLATTGAVMAAIGFISSASTMNVPHWLYLTYSFAVGLGLGLAFHTAYLMVMSSFDRYKGLANGLCQLCIAIGGITTPFLFTVVSKPGDRFQIKSLVTAIGFLTTLFFVVPQAPRRRAPVAGDRNRRYSTTSRNSNQEAVPLQGGPSSGKGGTTPINIGQGQARTRRRSQYLLAVSTSLLPNIPEEPESTHSANDTLASTSSESEIQRSSQSIATPVNKEGEPRETVGSQEIVEIKDEKSNTPVQNMSLKKESEGGAPTLASNSNAGKLVRKNSPPVEPEKKVVDSPASAPVSRQSSESQLTSSSSAKSITPVISRESSLQSSRASIQSVQSSRKGGSGTSRKGERIIDWSLLRDGHFLNLAVFSTLCTVTLVNYPVVLYVYIIKMCPGCVSEANVALMVIYVMDLIARLTFSYLSDLSVVSVRTGFLVSCVCAGISMTIAPFLKTMIPIYCFCVIFGCCLGILMTYEFLILTEAVGAHRFSRAFGFLNLFKLLLILVLGVILVNPLSIYMCSIHPLDVKSAIVGGNSSLTFDPFDLCPASTQDTVTSIRRVAINMAVPSILCALAWVTEDVYKATRKCTGSSSATKSQTSSQGVNADVP